MCTHAFKHAGERGGRAGGCQLCQQWTNCMPWIHPIQSPSPVLFTSCCVFALPLFPSFPPTIFTRICISVCLYACIFLCVWLCCTCAVVIPFSVIDHEAKTWCIIWGRFFQKTCHSHREAESRPGSRMPSSHWRTLLTRKCESLAVREAPDLSDVCF